MPTRHDLSVVKQAKGLFEGLKASWLRVKQGNLDSKRLGGDNIDTAQTLVWSSRRSHFILESTCVVSQLDRVLIYCPGTIDCCWLRAVEKFSFGSCVAHGVFCG